MLLLSQNFATAQEKIPGGHRKLPGILLKLRVYLARDLHAQTINLRFVPGRKSYCDEFE